MLERLLALLEEHFQSCSSPLHEQSVEIWPGFYETNQQELNNLF